MTAKILLLLLLLHPTSTLALSPSFAMNRFVFQCPESDLGIVVVYPDLDDCRSYYVCVHGQSLHVTCTGGAVFSMANLGCHQVDRVADCVSKKLVLLGD